MYNGKYLISLREKHGKTQKQVADDLGVSRQAVSYWECGNVKMSMDYVFMLSEYYDVPRREFLNQYLRDPEKTAIVPIIEPPKLVSNKDCILKTLKTALKAAIFCTLIYFATYTAFVALIYVCAVITHMENVVFQFTHSKLFVFYFILLAASVIISAAVRFTALKIKNYREEKNYALQRELYSRT